jgi:hypothetical protein
MSRVRVWDTDDKWLWPNLSYLLRLHGEERIDRYGGVDPGKGVDNDFAAVLIRKYDASGKFESETTKTESLVAAEWYPGEGEPVDGQTIVHIARSDDFTIHLGSAGIADSGKAGIWLIYADFLGARPPRFWPKEPEYAGGILAYFELDWNLAPDGRCEIDCRQRRPTQGTGFDWKEWVALTQISDDPKKTARLSD